MALSFPCDFFPEEILPLVSLRPFGFKPLLSRSAGRSCLIKETVLEDSLRDDPFCPPCAFPLRSDPSGLVLSIYPAGMYKRRVSEGLFGPPVGHHVVVSVPHNPYDSVRLSSLGDLFVSFVSP